MKNLQQKLQRLERFLKRDALRIIGIEAVNFFEESFQKQGFTDKHFEKWKKSKRTQKDSVWYGFEYRSRVPLPDNHPKRKGAKSKYVPRKSNPITNYSPAATKRPTLTGKTGDLGNSIEYRVVGNIVQVFSDKPYAKVQNDGGTIKVLGKKSVKLPPRKFMGRSQKLEKELKEIIHKEIKNILK